MTRLTKKLAASGLLSVVVILITSGAAEAKLSANHNDIVLVRR
jgi:hypothetical protein